MKLDEILDELAEAIKLPETKEEAIAYIQKDPSCLAFVEEMAFRQVIINVLVAANIISELGCQFLKRHQKCLFSSQLLLNILLKNT